MKKTSLTNIRWLFLSLLLATGVGSAWADTVTLSYSSTTTTNMTGNNDAATVGLSATDWSVVGAKGSSSNNVGLNKDGTIRLYYNASGSNTLTVSALNSNYTISTISIVFKESNANGTVSVGGNTVSATSTSTTNSKTTNVYAINGKSFVIGNGNTSNTQVHIYSIAITYTSDGSGTQTATVTFADQSKTLAVGDTYTNTATKTPSGLSVTYGSSDTSVATVTNAGLVTAVAAGTATITASWAQQTVGGTTYSAGSATYSVTVEAASSGDGTTETCMFSSKSWAATPSDWTSGQDGASFQQGRGVQVTAAYNGANATSPSSYTNINQIVVTYSTNANTGAGNVEIQVGSNASTSQTVTKTGGTSDRTLTYTYSTAQSGNVKITVNCTTNSIYIKSVAITYGGGGSTPTLTETEVTFPESSYSVSYPGNFTAPTATVSAEGSAISGATVTYSSSNTNVATVNQSTGAVTLVGGFGTTTITATYAGDTTYEGSTGSYTLTVTDGRTASTTFFPSSSYNAILGESFSSPTATVSAGGTTVSGASLSYISSNQAVATVVESTGVVSIVGLGTATITATFAGDTNYKGSSGQYTLNVTDSGGVGGEDVTIWSEDFSSFSTGNAPTSGTNATYICNNGGSDTKIYNENYAGGTAPELLVGKSGGYFLVTITSLKQCTGTLTLTFKSNKALTPTSNTSGVTITQSGSVSGTTYTYSISGASDGFTIKIPAGSANARVDDFVLTGTRRSDVTEVDEPTLSAEFTFWAATTGQPTGQFTIAPVTTGSTVRYTTDGSTPTTSNGNIITQSTEVDIHATTTVKAIAYVGNVTSGVVTKTYTEGPTVNDIASFKALDEGTEARLYLDPANDARVLHASGSEIYVRDNTGAICLYLNTSLQNPVPQHDYHVAGWIIGKYQPYNGLPEMVATSNTTTDYLAFAAPVTEAATEPVAISANDFDNYKADWVTITDLRAEGNGDNINVSDDDANTLKVYNKYNLNNDNYYQDPYNGALVDLTGLAVPYNSTKEIVPIYYNNARPIIYVIDENKEFRSPSDNIQNATVRLVRTLSNTNWNTFVIPMYMENFEGTIRRYDRAEGTTMMFVEEYGGIEAGMPYLVKPINRIENPVYSNVTLCSQPVKNIEADGYHFVGIYSPENIYEESKVNRFLKSDGYLYYPTDEDAGRLKGLRAYFVVPDGTGNVKVNPDGTATIIDEVQSTMYEEQGAIYDVSGRAVGNDLHSLPRGIYIVNGKKIVVR